MLNANGCLIAAGLGWLEGLLPLLFVVIWIVSQVMGVLRKAGQARREAAGPPQLRDAGDNAARDPQGLDREIEEFLKRSLSGQPKRQPSPPPPSPSSRERSRQRASGQRQRPPVSSGQPPLLPVQQSRVQQPLDQQSLVQQIRMAATRVGAADISSHVEAAFAHDLAHESPGMTASRPTNQQAAHPAAHLVAALRSPEGLRQLILMREILERPAFRQ